MQVIEMTALLFSLNLRKGNYFSLVILLHVEAHTEKFNYGGIKRYRVTFVDVPNFRNNNFLREKEYKPMIYEESRLQTQRYLTPKPRSLSAWYS